MALYLHDGDEIEARHLVSGMADVDVRGSRGTRIPRFVSAPDNRDFFLSGTEELMGFGMMGWGRRALGAGLMALMAAGVGNAQSLAERNEIMFQQMQQLRGVSGSEISRIPRHLRSLAETAGWGRATRPSPSTRSRPKKPPRAWAGRSARSGKAIATASTSASAASATWCRSTIPPRSRRRTPTVCADMFEYPNIPMVYPVVWVRASEAAQLCAAEGKRMGDAHEWERRLGRAASAARLPVRPRARQ